MNRTLTATICGLLLFAAAATRAQTTDPQRDILVTFHNDGARALSSGVTAPYRNRKRYAIGAAARRNADAVADEYALVEVDHWPIRSLSVYCFVYRVPHSQDRDSVIRSLQGDDRVESAQSLQEFETSTGNEDVYNDTHAGLQHGLTTMGIPAAHALSLGTGVRIAIIDSHAQEDHEDLEGRVRRLETFVSTEADHDTRHGTAIASVIGARANNGKGIVGVAPEAQLEIFVSCWSDATRRKAVCDSFTLAKSLDTLLDDPPDILNMSLTGPHDPLLARLISALHRADTIIVAAGDTRQFPASHTAVIGVLPGEGKNHESSQASVEVVSVVPLFAPGQHIMVARPDNDYDFSSGSSLAAAHVSGVIALLLALSPDLTSESALSLLQRSQVAGVVDAASINACVALQLANPANSCLESVVSLSELEPDTEDDS